MVFTECSSRGKVEKWSMKQWRKKSARGVTAIFIVMKNTSISSKSEVVEFYSKSPFMPSNQFWF